MVSQNAVFYVCMCKRLSPFIALISSFFIHRCLSLFSQTQFHNVADKMTGHKMERMFVIIFESIKFIFTLFKDNTCYYSVLATYIELVLILKHTHSTIPIDFSF